MLRALLTGTFDPPTEGHIKLIERAAAICEQLTVGIGENVNKPAPVLTALERIEAIKKEVSSLSNVEVMSFLGLTIDYAKEIGASVLIRGLR